MLHKLVDTVKGAYMNLRGMKYRVWLSSHGVSHYSVIEIVEGVDVLRVPMNGMFFVGYYPQHGCMVVSPEAEMKLTESQLQACYYHELGHKVHGHTESVYNSADGGLFAEMIADAHSCDHGYAQDMYDALVVIAKNCPVDPHQLLKRLSAIRSYL